MKRLITLTALIALAAPLARGQATASDSLVKADIERMSDKLMHLDSVAKSLDEAVDSSDRAKTFLQIGSTLVGVLVGAGLSLLAERRAWRRRKTEQLRDKQMQALIDILERIAQGIEICRSLSRALSAESQLGGHEGVVPSAGALIKDKVNAVVRNANLELEKIVNTCDLLYARVRLLHTRESGTVSVSKCLGDLHDIGEYLQSANEEAAGAVIQTLENRINILRNSYAAAIDAALSGLDE